MIALVLWFFLNISVTLLNKAFFAKMNAPYPMVITSVHLAVSATLSCMVLLFTSRYGSGDVPRDTQMKLFAMSFLFVANIVVGNASLAHASVPFVQMVRCTIPGLTAVANWIFFNTTYSKRTWLSLIPIITGAMMVCAGEVYLTTTGLSLTLLGCVLCSAKAIVTNQVLVGKDKVGTVPTLRTVATLGFMELGGVAFYFETPFFYDWLPNTTTAMLVLLFFHGVQAFMLNIANFEANKDTSPLVMTVAGNCKHVVTVMSSVALFGSSMTMHGAVGATITMLGAFWYSMEKQRSGEKKDTPADVPAAPEAEKEQLLDSSSLEIPSTTPLSSVAKHPPRFSSLAGMHSRQVIPLETSSPAWVDPEAQATFV